MKVNRLLDLNSLLSQKSHFLFGARGTGKSTLAEDCLGKKAFFVNLLIDDEYSVLARRPSALLEIIPPSAKTVVIDEIQRLPKLLNEAHFLIEKRKCRFLFTGSSAKKIKEQNVNLLGGRAWESFLFPLTWRELSSHFDLERYLSYGGLPGVYFSENPELELRAYTQLYLKEEIQLGALIRKYDLFLKFLDIAALRNGQEINYDSIASDSQVPPRTVDNYLQLLDETLFGFKLAPWKSKKRKAVSRAKFYFFDIGPQAYLADKKSIPVTMATRGQRFEHFIIQELRAWNVYSGADEDINYWRTLTQEEVDVVVGKRFGLEIKASSRVGPADIKGLLKLKEEKAHENYFLISFDKQSKEIQGIKCLYWELFLDMLWSKKL